MGGGGDLNLKGALPQWESLLMNNHTDEPQSEGGMGERETGRKQTRDEWRRKTNKIFKKRQKEAREIRPPKYFKNAAVDCFSVEMCCCFHMCVYLFVI